MALVTDKCAHELRTEWCGVCSPRVEPRNTRPWRAEERQLLREHLEDVKELGEVPYTVGDLADLLGRTVDSVEAQLYLLRHEDTWRELRHGAVRHREEWTQREIEIVLDPGLSGQQAARILGRTLAAVYMARIKHRR